MIAYLIGKLTFKGENKIFVEVKGVGYELLVSAFTLNNLPALLEEIKILTYMQVKDDGIVLIGFFTDEEKAMFTNLLQVSSVGPKLALAVLSGLSPALLACAIAKEDVKTISSIKGVGKKTSERIVLELKDKIDKSFAIGEFTHENNNQIYSNETEDAAYALISLGMSRNEALELAKSVCRNGDSVEDIVTKALKGIGR